MGDPAAPVVIVMYTDYQCQYCESFERDTLPVLVREYVETGKARLVVRHHPLEDIHPLAFDAAVAATCAARQGKFWEMHERLFGRQREVGPAVIEEIASGVRLDTSAFTACTASEDAAAQVRGDIESSVAAGLMGTPAFLIGVAQPGGSVKVTAVVNGARPAAEFAKTIDALLSGTPGTGQWAAPSVIALAAIAGSVVWLGRRRLKGRTST
jgi:protein-disulfide isomerase